VSKIALAGSAALVTMGINNGIEIRDDDIASIRTKGIIGEKYIKIIPGGSDDIIASGGRLSDTESAVDFEEIIGKIIHRME
jgi:phospholipid/cholesterol/gamma-HCH transport system substrate-binding protein